MKKNVYYNISLIASLVIVFVFFCYTNPFTHQQKTVNVPPPPIEDTTLTLFFAGDLMGHEPLINAAKIQNKDSFDINSETCYTSNNCSSSTTSSNQTSLSTSFAEESTKRLKRDDSNT